MNIPINYRENLSPLATKAPEETEVWKEAKKKSWKVEWAEETTISDLKTPIRDLAIKFAPIVYFIIWMLVMGAIASYWYGNKYENLMNAIERREELLWKMEYNNSVIRGKVEENATIRNQVLSDNEMMVEAIKTANGVKEQKIVEN